MAIQKLLLTIVVLGALLAPYHHHITEAADSMTKPGCQSTCGSLSIPYPFRLRGSSSECGIDPQSFIVDCDNSTEPPVPYMYNRSSNLEIIGISVEDHEMRVNTWSSRACYNASGYDESSSFIAWLKLTDFPISSTKNKFIAVGCDTWASFRARNRKSLLARERRYFCMSYCTNNSIFSNGSCSGDGCCETNIPSGSFGYNISIGSFYDHYYILRFNPCSYAFVAEKGSYSFSTSDFAQLKFNQFPLVLDWAIVNQTCEDAKKNGMCTNNADCTDAKNGSGCKCTCKKGYRGNPYLENGCHDIDECTEINPCEREAKCLNTKGNYTCSCPKGYHGDGRKGGGDGPGCIANPKSSPNVMILIGIAVGIVVLLFSIGFMYLGHEKRKLIKLKEQHFKQNGGLLLQQQLHERERTTKAVTIFSAEDLEKATDNYNESGILGRGGFGTVYKGSLQDNTVVAIKKSKHVDRSQIEQFINEIIVLSQINHRNVVKLLGCCLETEVPLLVYEFVNNGTLSDHIHNLNESSKLSWETRLRIASDTAGVLSYLHSAASIPIIHRDVKSANILLDTDYTAKVSDFGTSRLVPLDATLTSTVVQGTWGYLDPEYLRTSQLTEKSDVYSFGVVLVELLTGKKVLSVDRPGEERSLAMYFISSLRNDKLFQIVDGVIANEGNNEQVKEVANLAERCLKMNGEERPDMKEVAMELEGLRAMANHPWVSGTDVNREETVHLLGEKPEIYMDSIGTMNTGYTDSMTNQSMPLVSTGR